MVTRRIIGPGPAPGEIQTGLPGPSLPSTTTATMTWRWQRAVSPLSAGQRSIAGGAVDTNKAQGRPGETCRNELMSSH